MPFSMTAPKRAQKAEQEVEDSDSLLHSKPKKTKWPLFSPMVKKAFHSCFTKSSIANPPVVITVSTIYRTRFTDDPNDDLDIGVKWARNHDAPIVSIEGSNEIFWTQKKGKQSFLLDNSSLIDIHWDVSSAKYGAGGPEPTKGFLVAVVYKGSALFLGDMVLGFLSKTSALLLGDMISAADFDVIQRKEQVVGNELYSTKAPLTKCGVYHDIMVMHKKGSESQMWVWVDKRVVAHVRNLEHNFRGCVELSVDGSPIVLMWDLLDWCRRGPRNGGFILFQTRRTPKSQLWMEEEILSTAGCLYSFMIQVSHQDH